MVTPPLLCDGGHLLVNVDAGSDGQLRVAVEDADGTALPGHALTDCEAVVGDATSLAVSWRNADEVSIPVGRPLRLRFELNACRLFAFEFQPSSRPA